MQWVNENAKALGADTTRVTIFGESAGGFSVCWHLVNPISAKYFTRAIIESGNCASQFVWAARTNTDKYSAHYANSVGCASSGSSNNILTCLRALSANDVFDGDLYGPDALMAPLMPWAVAIDGTATGLMDVPVKLMRAGKFNRVPVILGTTNNEGDMFIPAVTLIVGVPLPLIEFTFDLVVQHFWQNTSLSSMLVTFYDHEITYEDILSASLRDWFFACPSRMTAAALSQYVPTYLYHWTFLADNWIDNRFLGDLHSAEIQFVYGNAWPPVVHWFNQRDLDMVSATQNYWLSMALHGDPNALGGNVAWPAYNTSQSVNIRLDQPVFQESDYSADICLSLWNNFPF